MLINIFFFRAGIVIAFLLLALLAIWRFVCVSRHGPSNKLLPQYSKGPDYQYKVTFFQYSIMLTRIILYGHAITRC